LDIAEVQQTDAALIAVLDLADILLEAPERRNLPLMDDPAIPDEAHGSIPEHLPLADKAASDRPEPGDAECGPDLGPGPGPFDKLQLQHPLHPLLDLGDRTVDHVVEPDPHPFPLGQSLRLRMGPDSKA